MKFLSLFALTGYSETSNAEAKLGPRLQFFLQAYSD